MYQKLTDEKINELLETGIAEFAQNGRERANINDIAIALRNATLYQSEQWRRQVADSLRDVAILLSANVAVSQLMDTILTELESNLPCEASAIWLVDENAAYGSEQDLQLAACHGVSAEKMVEIRQQSGFDAASAFISAIEHACGRD